VAGPGRLAAKSAAANYRKNCCVAASVDNLRWKIIGHTGASRAMKKLRSVYKCAVSFAQLDFAERLGGEKIEIRWKNHGNFHFRAR
jgi:hypothetical protein